MKHELLLTIALGAAACCDAFAAPYDVNTSLVDPDATAPAVELYEYLLDNYGTNVITGAVASGVKDIRMADYIAGVTGHYPLINCFDFMEHYQCAPVNSGGWSSANYSKPDLEADWVAKGGIVSYQWHWFVPISYNDRSNFSRYEFYCNNGGGSGKNSTEFSLANAMREGTWERDIIDRDLDAVAGYLLEMQRRGIPVLWRPLHEACGNNGKYSGGQAWFWWGNSGADAYKALWRYMFERFRDKGVHNLIWVWTSCGGDADWYPGDDVVDIIGRDYYENQQSKFHKSIINEYNYLHNLSPHKMLALTECGAIPSLDAMSASGDMWSWVVPWNDDYTTGSYHNSADFFRQEYSNPNIIHRDNRGDTSNPPADVDYDSDVMYDGSPVEMTWSTTYIHVTAAQAAKIKAGDKLSITVSEIGNISGKYPKVMLRCDDGWTAIHQFDIWYDRGKQMPIVYTVTVTDDMLGQLHKGFFLGGEDCKVTRLELLSRSTSGIDSTVAAPDTPLRSDLYTIQGILLHRDVTLDEVRDRLPAGLYIHGGRKILIR